jgi:uncharacterized membrane protein
MSEMTNVKLPQPGDVTKREREDAMGAYLMMFAAWGIGLPLPILNMIAAGIYYGINNKKSRFVAFHALQSLLSQIPVTLANLAGVIWAVRNFIYSGFDTEFWIYLVFAGLLNLAYVVTSLVAMTRAWRGNFFYIPLFGRWAYETWYGEGSRAPGVRATRDNKPPGGY